MTRREIRRPIAIGVTVLLIAAGCAGGVSREETTAAIAQLGADDMAALVPVSREATDAVTDACASGQPGDVEAAADQVAVAQTRWHETEAWWMGPATDLRANALVDWPVNTDDVDELLAAAEPVTIDADYLAEFVGADTRGYGAAAYLLDGAPLDDRACDYATAATVLAASTIDEVASAWTESTDAASYQEQLTATGGLDAVVNHVLMLLSSRESAHLGARSASIERVLFGADGDSGLAVMVDDDLAARLRVEADRMVAVAGPVEQPSVEQQSAGFEEAAEALRATVATEVVAKLGIKVTFSDADGDSAG